VFICGRQSCLNQGGLGSSNHDPVSPPIPMQSTAVCGREEINVSQNQVKQLPVEPDRRVLPSDAEKMKLRQQIQCDLSGNSGPQLKDVYLEMTKCDPHLTGFAKLCDLDRTLAQCQVISCINMVVATLL